MSRTADQILASGLRHTPEAWKNTAPLLAGGAAALALAEAFVLDLAAMTVPSTAEAEWLDLLAEGLGLGRGEGEDDASLQARVAARATGIIKADIKAAVDAILAPEVCQVFEDWELRVYLDAGSGAEYVTTLVIGEQHLLPQWRGLTVICPEGLTDAVELSICATVRDLKAAGIIAAVLFDDDLDEVVAGYWFDLA